jgi:homoserine kinase type II
MAVHTPLSAEIIAGFVRPYHLGELHNFTGISDGIENTNYLITLKTMTLKTGTPSTSILKKTTADHQFSLDDYILTVFENLSAADVDFYMQLMSTLAANGLPVPQPIIRPDSKTALQSLMNKPALLLSRLNGTHPRQPTNAQCHAIGNALARQHRLTFDMHHLGQQSLQNMLNTGSALLPTLNTDNRQLLNDELNRAQRLLARTDLPIGLIHGDLFRDNTLFAGDALTGLLDYYSATTGPLLLDVAIAANDWCDENYQLISDRTTALLEGYEATRPLTRAEKTSWQDCLRCGALRFWISRLANPLQPKDPDAFRQRLINLRKPLI